MSSYRNAPAVMVKIGIVAPTMNAEFVGQIYVDTVAPKSYIAIKTGTGATDWQQVGGT